jgi:hypothetical protein
MPLPPSLIFFTLVGMSRIRFPPLKADIDVPSSLEFLSSYSSTCFNASIKRFWHFFFFFFFHWFYEIGASVFKIPMESASILAASSFFTLEAMSRNSSSVEAPANAFSSSSLRDLSRGMDTILSSMVLIASTKPLL